MKCPDGHVNYEINPYTFSDSVLNEDKNYCPVCGKLLISERENKQSISYVKHDSQIFTIRVD